MGLSEREKMTAGEAWLRRCNGATVVRDPPRVRT